MKTRKVDLKDNIKFIEDLSREDSKETLINEDNTKCIEDLMKGLINNLWKGQSIETIKGLDSDQVWAMINMLSTDIITKYNQFKGKESLLERELSKVMKDYSNYNMINLGKKRKRPQDKGEDDEDEEEKDNEEDIEEAGDDDIINNDDGDEDMDEGDIEKDEDENEEGKDEDINKKTKLNNKKKKDQFFSMNEMNEFADKFEEDNNENINELNNQKDTEGDNDNEEEEEEIEENDSKSSVKYNEFFDEVNTSKGNQINSKEIDTENHLFNQIKAIEAKMIAPKAWNLKGEVIASERPKESLLESPMDFEVSIKPPPVPDESYTEALESMIKLRIKDDLFDDPIRRARVNLNQRDNNNNTKSQYELQFAKDDKGLSQIYEDKYLGTEATEGKADQIKAECEEISNELYDIFNRLTNENFAPYKSKGKEEVKVTNVPSIQIEEISNYVSNNKGVNANAKELLNTKLIKEKTKEELTKEEKQMMHNRKKRNIRTHIHQKEKRKKMNQLTNELGSKFEAKMELRAQRNKQLTKEQKSNEYKSTQLFANIQKMTMDKKNAKENNDLLQANGEGNKDIKKYKL